MTDLSKVTAVVFDHGSFVELALRLGRDLGKVYYATPWETAFSKINDLVVGDGFEEIERVNEIWDVIDKVDLAVFPDVNHGAMQLHIESLGIPVWGSRHADSLELKKLRFKELQKRLDMSHANFEVIEGLTKLREYCRDHEEKWIKLTPQFRGHKETFFHKDYEHSLSDFDELATEFGGLQDRVKFLIEDPIDAELESGGDFYCIDGQFPDYGVQGYEIKNLSYFAVVQKYSDMPPQIRDINEALSETLKEFRYRNFFSTEIKITDDGDPYLLEPTCRFPSPAGEEQLELYRNISSIIVEGANGRLEQPEIVAEFACEAMMEHEGPKDNWRQMTIPKENKQWVKVYNLVCLGGDSYLIPPGDPCIGAVVGIGDTPRKSLEHLKENVAALKDEKVAVHVESLTKALEEIEEAQKEGIHFTDKPIPEPAAVLEST